MNLKLEDVSQVSLVMVGIRLLNTSDERDEFNRVVQTEVSEAPGVGELMFNAPEGTTIDLAPKTLVLNRDRISLTLIPDRSTISREYPAERDLERLGDVAASAIESSNLKAQQLRAFGFNINLVFEIRSGETAIQFIGSRMFTPDPFGHVGFRFLGGQCKLHLRRDGLNWNITVEPRRGDLNTNRVFVSLNLHKDESKIPSRTLIAESLKEVWTQAHSIVSSLARCE